MTGASESFETVSARVKSRGHWRIHLFPNAPETERLSFSDAKALLRRASVSLRGVAFPTVPDGDTKHSSIYIRRDHLEAWADYSSHKEVWRFYLTGQFAQLRDVWEDWIAEDPWIPETSPLKKIPVGKCLDFVGVTLLFTELFLFIKNLVELKLYDSPITLELSLVNTLDRVLTTFEPRYLSGEYRTRSETIDLGASTLELSEIRERHLDLAVTYATRLFEQFNWERVSADVLREDQKRLLERRL